MNKTAILCALASAALFGVSTPAVKVLLGSIHPALLAGLLYCGAGLGVAVLRRAVPRGFGLPPQAELNRRDIRWLGLAIGFGGVAGPLLMMFGLGRTEAATASLLLTLEGAAKVIDPKMQVEANTIQINDRTKTKTASKNVKTVSTESGERVLVTADGVTATEDTAIYTGNPRERVHLYRGAGFIEAERVEGPIGSKAFRATATGHVFSTMNNLRAWADRLEYDDGTHIAHYIGSVTALKQDMKITSADMIVKLNDDAPRAPSEFTESSVQEITARGKVLITRSTSRGTGDQAVYDADSQQIVLTGSHPEVSDGQGTTTQGPRITVNVSGDKMTVVEGSGSQQAVTTHRVKP